LREIALFIPCFNEENRIQVKSFKKFIENYKYLIDFYFIDDGSTDQTSNIILENLIDNKYTFLIQLADNLGKGNALREGILKVNIKDYKYFGFIDADLDIPLIQITKLYEEILDTPYLTGISSRKLISGLSAFRFRSLGSIAIVIIANHIIQLRPYLKDTQCGCKLFKREILDVCFKDEFISEWLFDIELFLRLKRNMPGVREYIREVPLISLSKSTSSNFKIQQNLKIFKQLYLINNYYK
jgi:dolichyl-phosphate beta-glucosyltransferase